MIPGLSNLVPAIISKAWEAGEAGDVDGAREYDAKVMAATQVTRLASGGSFDAARFSGMKAALKLMGILEHDTVARPFRALTKEEKRPIPGILKELGLAA